jgi:hypothetical protein
MSKEGRTEWIELVPHAPAPQASCASEEGIHAQESQAQDAVPARDPSHERR